MNKIIIIIIVAISITFIHSSSFAKINSHAIVEDKVNVDEVTIDGVKYYKIDDNSAACVVDPEKKKNLTQLNLKSKVDIRGKYFVVREIPKNAFRSCKNLTTVTIPATVRKIGRYAFAYNSNLESITFLTNDIEFEQDRLIGGVIGPFFDCKNIKNVNWPNNEIPACALTAFEGNRSSYGNTLTSSRSEINGRESINSNVANGKGRMVDNGPKSFADFASEKVAEVYNNWVRKKPYESAAQYKLRTSDEQCEARKRELFENARNEYINLYTSPVIAGTLGEYDTDYKVFTISVNNGEYVYAQVPLSDKFFFEDNFEGVSIKPTYNIVNNKLAIVDCKFEIGSKSYISPEIYDGVADDYSSMDFEARKLDIDGLLAEDNSSKSKASAVAPSKNPNVKNSLSAVEVAPSTGFNNVDTYALVIGNENYKYNDPVKFALSDATTFARYCKNTLGVPSTNIIAVQDVTKGELRRTLRDVTALFEDEGEKKNLIVYYAGHGVPDANNVDSYILPVDASASDIESCYSLQEFYNQLGNLSAKSVVVYLDACFSGAGRSGKALVASRAGVSFERTKVEPRGNTVVFAATSADETAQPYEEAGHGVFTYFLLDKLKSTNGNITLGDLSKYLITKVKSQSNIVGKKHQVPSMIVSSAFEGDWKAIPVTLMR